MHQHPTGFFHGGQSISSQVSFFYNEFIFSFITTFHLGLAKASYAILGITTIDNWFTNDWFDYDK